MTYQLNMFDRVDERQCSPVTWTNEDKRMIGMSILLTQHSIASSNGSESMEQRSYYAHAGAAEFIRDNLMYSIINGLEYFASCSHSSMTRSRDHVVWLGTDDGRRVYGDEPEQIARFNGLADESLKRYEYLTGLTKRVQVCSIADLPIDIPAIAKAAAECRARAFTLIDPLLELPALDADATGRLTKMFPDAFGDDK